MTFLFVCLLLLFFIIKEKTFSGNALLKNQVRLSIPTNNYINIIIENGFIQSIKFIKFITYLRNKCV